MSDSWIGIEKPKTFADWFKAVGILIGAVAFVSLYQSNQALADHNSDPKAHPELVREFENLRRDSQNNMASVKSLIEHNQELATLIQKQNEEAHKRQENSLAEQKEMLKEILREVRRPQ